MTPYHKIENIFVRSPETHLLEEGQFRKEEFRRLAPTLWLLTEKVDGMNVRVMWDGERVTFAGRTDNANMPPRLIECLTNLFPVELMGEVFQNRSDDGAPFSVCLYGEGYGGSIQGKGRYRAKEPQFILFDIAIQGIWLNPDNVAGTASSLGCEVVPTVDIGTLYEAVDIARKRFTSALGDREAEGIVAKPFVGLLDRFGNRIITKIKSRDFAAA